MIPTPPSSSAPASWAYHTPNNACIDCHHPEDSSKLPENKLTEQCTDQCVVITCDDPEHAALCRDAEDLVHCDLECDATVDCTDCNGFDAFLQCCNDDTFCHGLPANTNASGSGAMWAAMQEWCAACDNMDPTILTYTNPTNAHHQHHHQKHSGQFSIPTSSYTQSQRVSQPVIHSQTYPQPTLNAKHTYAVTESPANSANQADAHWHHHDRYPSSADFRMQRVENIPQPFSQAHIHDPSGGFVRRTHGHSYSSNSIDRGSSVSTSSVDGPSFFSSSSIQTPATTAPTPTYNCMWSACQASFSSMPDLVNHVNQNHLAISSGMTDAPHVDSRKERACLWGNCDDTSFFSVSDSDQFLNHLLSVHLQTSPMEWQSYQAPQIQSTGQFEPSMVNTLTISSAPSSASTSTSASSSLLSSPASKASAPAELPPDDAVARQAAATQPQVEDHVSGSGCTSAAGGQHVHECRWKDCEHPSFSTCDELTAHITEGHIGGGRAHYECFWDGCTRNGDQGFQSKQKICRHVQSHTGHRPFQCSICHQNFSEAATLQQHIRRHTQEKPYVCDFPGCGKSFAITGALTIHKRTHNGDKPFKCTYCDRGFAESSNLSKHLRTHTGARPYECAEPGCNKAFARPDQLNRHKAVHKKQIRGVGGQVGVQ